MLVTTRIVEGSEVRSTFGLRMFEILEAHTDFFLRTKRGVELMISETSTLVTSTS